MLSKKIKLIIIIGCIVGGALCGALIPILMISTNKPPENQVITLNESSEVALISDPPPEVDMQEPQVPNITATLDCIDDFVAENLTAYVGDDVIPDFGLLTHIRIVLDWIYIYDDHDLIGAGISIWNCIP